MWIHPLWINFSYWITMQKSLYWFTLVPNAIALTRLITGSSGLKITRYNLRGKRE
jgi:hypothetical protein